MEKVKLTEEQAEAIRYRVDKETAIEVHLSDKGWTKEFNKPLNSLTLDEFVRALYIGYEVEPEFNVGDWVTFNKSYVSVVIGVPDDKYLTLFINGSEGDYNKELCRHATPKEIEIKLERNWWANHGRDV